MTGAVRSGYPEANPFGDYPYQYGYEFDRIGNHLKQTKNGTAFAGRYNNLNELMERAVTGPVRVQGTADGVLPIGVKVDGAAAQTQDVDQDTAAYRGDSRPITTGQTGAKTISVVATDSSQPPKRTEQTRSVQLPASNPVAFSYVEWEHDRRRHLAVRLDRREPPRLCRTPWDRGHLARSSSYFHLRRPGPPPHKDGLHLGWPSLDADPFPHFPLRPMELHLRGRHR